MSDDKVACRTPTDGRDGATRIPAWKFDLMRREILNVLETGETAFSDLPEAVRARLSEDDRARLGSLGWHVTTVKLELEVRGEIERVPNHTPQVLRRAGLEA